MAKTTDTLINIGPVSRRWLAEIGIYSLNDLKKAGVIETYLMLKAHNPKVSLNMLWGLEAAVRNVHWLSLTKKDKESLIKKLEGKSSDSRLF